MPADIGWLVAERVLYSRSWGIIDINTVESHADFLITLLDSGDTPNVYLLIDTLDVTQFDVGLKILNRQVHRYLTHKRLICNIDITQNTKNQMLGHVVSDIAKIQWTNVRTLEQAIDYVSSLDTTLATLDVSLFDIFTPLETFE